VLTIRDLLPLLRSSCHGYNDEQATIILAFECEDWTWVNVNLSSWVLDALADCVVDNVDVCEEMLRLWIRTGEYGIPVRRPIIRDREAKS
jgi:hypothetical protein